MTENWLITGANGNLGRRLIELLLKNEQQQVVAVVRSARAQQQIDDLALSPAQRSRLQVRVLNYTDVDALRAAAQGCNKAVHLVGILKETKQASYHDAHEASTEALLTALQGGSVDHITYLSIVGSTPSSGNKCLASKGRAEQLLRQSNLATCILRVPMVLGEGDYASYALAKRAGQARSFGFRVTSMEQPIYAGDVVAAILQAADQRMDVALDLAGPEALTRRALTQRAAQVMGQEPPLIISLPLSLGLALAAVLQTVSANPPMTVAMLEVLDHDDVVDPQPALEQLGLEGLMSLDEMLGAVLSAT